MSPKVFISHASDDKKRFVIPFATSLRAKGIDAWVDKWEIQPGDKIVTKIFEEGIKEAQAFIIVVSKNSVNSKWVREELDSVMVKNIDNTTRLIPIVIDDCEIPVCLQHINYIHIRDCTEFSSEIDQIYDTVFDISGKPPLTTSIGSMLADRIKERRFWGNFEKAAIQAATMGGVTAMSFYRKEQEWPSFLSQQESKNKNPSTLADLYATSTIIQTIDTQLSPLSNKLSCGLCYLGEETNHIDWFNKKLSKEVADKIQKPGDFFSGEQNVLRVIVDGIDGTESFMRGIPLFCSSVSIVVGTQPRVSAIYDPIHNVVYSGILKGPTVNEQNSTEAYKWQVGTGNRIDLSHQNEQAEKKSINKEAIGFHITRTNSTFRHDFLKASSEKNQSKLERLASIAKCTYALNSGVLAMAEVAAGSLGGFVNNITNLWDVAAGEVLVKACSGKVTDFSKNKISYNSGKKVSVIAAKEHLHEEIFKSLED